MTADTLKAEMELVDGRVKFSARVEGKEPIQVDYVPPVGGGDGYTSLELLLISMGTCLGTGVKVMAENRLGKSIRSLAVDARGARRETHPTSFEEVGLTLRISSPDLEAAELEELIALAEKKICPVLDMVKGNAAIRVDYELDAGPFIRGLGTAG